jgi:four helix bundle protein
VTVARFEQLIAWQKARALACSIHGIVDGGRFARDFAFRTQLWQAALSVPSNVEEGFERFNPAEFAHFLSIAKASCAEVRSDLYVAFDIGYIDESTLNTALAQAISCGEMIGRLRARVAARIAKRPRSTQHSARSTRI